MPKKTARKKATNSMDFSLLRLHRAFNDTRDRLKEKPKTPAREKLHQDLNGAQAMVVCDQGMFRRIGAKT